MRQSCENSVFALRLFPACVVVLAFVSCLGRALDRSFCCIAFPNYVRVFLIYTCQCPIKFSPRLYFEYQHLGELGHAIQSNGPLLQVKVVLYPLTSHFISLHDECGQMEDIENYIKSVVNADQMMRRWNAADKQLVITVLTNKAHGM